MILSAEEIIRRLNLNRHPEGGWYKETWRAPATQGMRPSGTAIYFLLSADERSHWHRIDATEIWIYNAGAPLQLELSDDGQTTRNERLGPDLANGEAPQAMVPPYCWQAASSLGAWTLVTCTVSPGFQFEHFELAAPDWAPHKG